MKMVSSLVPDIDEPNAPVVSPNASANKSSPPEASRSEGTWPVEFNSLLEAGYSKEMIDSHASAIRERYGELSPKEMAEVIGETFGFGVMYHLAEVDKQAAKILPHGQKGDFISTMLHAEGVTSLDIVQAACGDGAASEKVKSLYSKELNDPESGQAFAQIFEQFTNYGSDMVSSFDVRPEATYELTPGDQSFVVMQLRKLEALFQSYNFETLAKMLKISGVTVEQIKSALSLAQADFPGFLKSRYRMVLVPLMDRLPPAMLPAV